MFFLEPGWLYAFRRRFAAVRRCFLRMFRPFHSIQYRAQHGANGPLYEKSRFREQETNEPRP